MTSDPICASLKKGTTAACPKNGKTHFRKTRLPEIGTVAQRFPGFGSKTFRRMSRIRQNSFPENTFGQKWDINARDSGIFTPKWAKMGQNGNKCAFFLLGDFG